MPHCRTCTQFYPSSWGHGCIRCQPKVYTGPYCEGCGKIHTGVAEVDAGGLALRPMCPDCGRGPLVPSTKEMLRREQGVNVRIDDLVSKSFDKFLALPEGESALCEIGLDRTLNGTTLTVKSPVIEDFLKKWSEKAAKLPDYPGIITGRPDSLYAKMKGYETPSVTLSNGCVFSQWRYIGRDMSPIRFGGEGRVDMSFLRVVGLSEGITLAMPGVYSPHYCETILTTLVESSKLFYLEIMQDFQGKALVTTKMVTK